MAETILLDPDYYTKNNHDPTQYISRLIRISVTEVWDMGLINKNVAKLLMLEHSRVPIFYALPKIHKKVTHFKEVLSFLA